MISLKKIWKSSRFRFYFINAKWNISFWLFAKKIFKEIIYETEDGEYIMDDFYKVVKPVKKITKRKFVGWFYKNNIYLDNPGMPIKTREEWEAWKKRGLL